MGLDSVTNFGKCSVSAGYDAAATSIALAANDGQLLPNPVADGPFNFVWWNSTDYFDPADQHRAFLAGADAEDAEMCRCTARTTDTLSTIVRAQEGSSATAHNKVGKSYKIILALTAKMIADIKNMHVENEVPAGAVDGVNAAFGLANAPITGSVKLYRNGARQISGFSVSGSTITFNAGNLPQPGDELMADYRK